VLFASHYFTINYCYFFLGGCGVDFGVGFGGLFFEGLDGLPGLVLGLGGSIIGFLIMVLLIYFFLTRLAFRCRPFIDMVSGLHFYNSSLCIFL